jgi:hypothetical protein
MRIRLFLAVVSVGLSWVFAGCTNPVQPGANGTGNGDGGGSGPLDGSPLTVQVNLSSTTSSGVVDSTGGEIGVTDQNGNVVTLSIPEGAVYEEHVSITVISSLDGATLSGGLLTGVDIQPDGLQLLKPATLTIEPADPDIIADLLSLDSAYLLTVFAYRGDGSDFHYYPYRIVDGKIEMSILGFSGYGGGKANQEDRRSQKDHPPSDPRDQASQEIEEILTEEMRQQQEDPEYTPPEQNQERLTDILRRWLYDKVIPMAETAETDDSILHCAVIEWLTWEAQAQILGVIDGDRNPFAAEVATITAHIKKGYENALNRSHQRAMNNNDASEISMTLLLEAESQLLGFDLDASGILAKIRRFELEFESEISESGGGFTVGVETETIELTFDEYLFRYEGTGQISHVKVDFLCMISHSVTPGNFLADTHDIPAPLATRPSCSGKTLPTKPTPSPYMMLVIATAPPPFESVTIQCEDHDEPVPYPYNNVWFGSFGFLHEDILNVDHGFLVTGWDFTYGQPYATKTLSKTADGLIGTPN